MSLRQDGALLSSEMSRGRRGAQLLLHSPLWAHHANMKQHEWCFLPSTSSFLDGSSILEQNKPYSSGSEGASQYALTVCSG